MSGTPQLILSKDMDLGYTDVDSNDKTDTNGDAGTNDDAYPNDDADANADVKRRGSG